VVTPSNPGNNFMEDDEQAAIEGGQRLWTRRRGQADNRLPEDLGVSPEAIDRMIEMTDRQQVPLHEPLPPETLRRIDEVVDRLSGHYLSDEEIAEIQNGETIKE
jgi:hypothetical protein